MKKIFKRSLSILLAAVIVFSAVPLSGFVGLELPKYGGFKKLTDTVADFFDGFATKAKAASYSGTCGKNLTWELDASTGELVISGTGYMYSWSWISGPSWSEYDDIITKVVINEGILNIGSFAFDSCLNLKEIFISGTVSSIDSFVFGGCSSLNRIVVAENNASFFSDETGVLFNKAKNNLIKYPIGKEEQKYTVPDSVKTISADAFEECNYLSAVEFGVNSQLAYLSTGAFSNCSNLQKIENLPDSLTYIGQSTFSGCESLTDIMLPNALSDIDSSAFYGCSSLIDIIIPDSVNIIGDFAFAYCENLKSITIPEGITSIRNNTFYNCYLLEDVVIPESVFSIGESAFENCERLTSIIIPSDVITIGERAFFGCDYLTAVLLPETLTDIGDYAFEDCYVLDDVYYAGTEKDWNDINIGTYNEQLTDSIFNYDYILKIDVELNCFNYSQNHTINNYFSINENYKNTYFNGMAVPLDGSNGTPDMCIPGLSEDDDMVPQGIAYYNDLRGRKWILISAYSSKGCNIKNRASVIYALDFYTGEYVAEFIVYNFDKTPHTGHLGGIAASEGCLYIADSDSKISYISLDKLAVKEGTSKSIIIEGSYDVSSYLNGAEVSYLSYSDDYLWFGNFYHTTPEYNTPASSTHNSLLLGYKVTNNSFWRDDDIRDVNDYESGAETGVFKAKEPNYVFEIPNSISKIQGVAVSFGFPHEVVLISSYGRGNPSTVYSFRFIFDRFTGSDPNWVYTVTDSDVSNVQGLPMLEGAFAYNGYIYMITESAAFYYNGYDPNNKSKDATDVVWRAYHDYTTPDIPSEPDNPTEDPGDEDDTEIKYRLRDLDGNYLNYYYTFDDGYFEGSSSKYNHDLCVASLSLAMQAGTPDHEKNDKPYNAIEMFKNIGFDYWKPYGYETDPEINSIACIIASKEGVMINGKKTTIVAVAVRGQGYRSEWGGNFVIGNETDHEGFRIAADKVLKNLNSYLANYYTDNNVIYWVTGYSRSAATANLVAAELNSGAEKYAFIEKTNPGKERVFSYNFATPQNTTDKKASSSSYDNIFNVVNPIDPVPAVAPSAWDFTRYGVTYYLPAQEYTPGYNKKDGLCSKMKNNYQSITGSKYYESFTFYELKYNADADTLMFMPNKTIGQMTYINKLVDIIAKHMILTRNNFVKNYQDAFSKLIAMLSGSWKADDYSDYSEGIKEIVVECIMDPNRIDSFTNYISIAISSVLNIEYDDVYELVSRLFKWLIPLALLHPGYLYTTIDMAIQKDPDTEQPVLFYPHLLKIYLSWLTLVGQNNITETDILTKAKSYRELKANCPIDINVYDSNGILVASIVNNEPVYIEDNSLSCYVDENGQKCVALPEGEEYRVEMIATGSGEVNCSVHEIADDSITVERIINYTEMSVINGDKLICIAENADETEKCNYPVTNQYGEIVKADVDISGSEIKEYTVTVNSIEEGAAVLGGGNFKQGEFAQVSAVAVEDYEFCGWYVDGKCVSVERQYRFAVNKDIEISAYYKTVTKLSIKSPSVTTVKYGDSFILHADVTGVLPDGAKIVWEASNGNFEVVEVADDGSTCTITPKSSGETTFTVKVVSSEGKLLAEDSQNMTSKAGFFDKIFAFFKKIFGLTKTIPQIYRGVF